MKIIEFDGKYIDKIIDLWNRELYADMLSVEAFSSLVLGDVNFNKNLFLLAVEEDRILGFIWAVKRRYPYLERGLEPHRGYIVSQAVTRDYQNQGIATALLKKVETQMKEEGTEEVTLGAYSPNYLFPGVDKNNYANAISFYSKNSYISKGNAVSMNQTLIDYIYPKAIFKQKQKLEDLGYKFLKFDYKDSTELIDFLITHFGSGWTSNVQESLKRMDATETLIICRNKEDEIVGYCQRAIDGHPDRFGPFGVDASLRGLGIGSVLFNEMLHDMTKRGIHHVYFLWTGGRAQSMYERQGMKAYREYELMRKTIQ